MSPTPAFAESLHGDLIEERSRLEAAGIGPLATWLRLATWSLEVSCRLVGLRLRARSGARGYGAGRPMGLREAPVHRPGSGPVDRLVAGLGQTGRGLCRSPLFAGLVILNLALGIGATTAMFGILETVLLRTLPYEDPEGIVMVWPVFEDRGPGELSAANAEFLDVRERVDSFRQVAAVDYRDLAVGGADRPEEVRAAAVSAEIFPLLGIEPDRGRAFTAAEDAPGGDRVAILSQALWVRRFGADPEILGGQVRLGTDLHTVVGVMPSGFRLPTDHGSPRSTEVWVPLALDSADPGFRGLKDLDAIVARLEDGVTLATAQQDLIALAAATRHAHPESYPAERGWSLVVRRPLQAAREAVQETLTLMMAAATLVLVIAVANVALLMLGRAREREREVAVRLALGAGRGHLFGQFLAESTVLSVLSVAGGLLLARFATALARVALPADFPRLQDVGIDATALGFALVVSGATAVGFGLVPTAWVARRRSLMFPAGLRAARRRSRGEGRLLVVGEIALALVLTVACGLLLRTLRAYGAEHPGFEAEDVVTFGLSLPGTRYESPARIQGFYASLLADIETLPGVTVAGAARRRPLADPMGTWGIEVEETTGGARRPEVRPEWQVVTPGYFGVLRIRLLEGRFFASDEGADTAPVAVVNRALAAAYWPGGSAVGMRLRLDGSQDNPWVTVVGVAGDVRHAAIDADVAPKIYLLHEQYAAISSVTAVPSLHVLVRATGEPGTLIPALHAAVWRLDPELPVTDVATMESIVSGSLAGSRLVAAVLSVLAALALALAASGVYGVMAALVVGRHREIGIRIALGADRRSILAMVLRDGLLVTLVGLVLGSVAAIAAARSIEGFLYGVEPSDPVTFGAVVALLASVAVAASAVPAVHATRVDPVASIGD